MTANTDMSNHIRRWLKGEPVEAPALASQLRYWADYFGAAIGADVEKLKSEQGANITYLRHKAAIAATIPRTKALAKEIERACDDIEAYREIVGFILKAEVLGLNTDDHERFTQLVTAMTWGNP